MNMKLFLVQTIRYGNDDLGVHLHGIFDETVDIHLMMSQYNSYRGGKYPAYYITELTLNEEELFDKKRVEI